jgi:hypothetical protein
MKRGARRIIVAREIESEKADLGDFVQLIVCCLCWNNRGSGRKKAEFILIIKRNILGHIQGLALASSKWLYDF